MRGSSFALPHELILSAKARAFQWRLCAKLHECKCRYIILKANPVHTANKYRIQEQRILFDIRSRILFSPLNLPLSRNIMLSTCILNLLIDLLFLQKKYQGIFFFLDLLRAVPCWCSDAHFTKAHYCGRRGTSATISQVHNRDPWR